METHHPHHPTHKKKWTEYLLEFFMLFLAVFLGFLAENKREANVEKSREKEYIASMVDDLKQDSLKIKSFLPELNELEAALDTLIHQCSAYKDGKADTREMYFIYHKYCRGWKDLKLYDKTLVQLKSSGNMRLINASVVDTMSLLDAALQFYNEQLYRMYDVQNKVVEMGLNIFDYNEYEKANTVNGHIILNDSGFLKISYQPALIKTDPVYVQQFANRVGFFRNFVLSISEASNASLPGINHYIMFLKNHYHLKDE